MPNLNCGVGNCAYNQGGLCSLNSVKVNGSFANSVGATCCGSFVEKGGFTNAVENMGPADLATDVACEAEKCCHNENCKCHAHSIDISGDYAQSQENTQCSSFESK